MRVFLMVSALLLVCAPAYAIDEFGDRFGTSAPLALGEDAAAVLGLEPAAGEEQESGEEADTEADKGSGESEAEQDSESEDAE